MLSVTSPDAAIDAIAPVQLYDVLAPALEKKQEEMRITIPENWYSVNGKYGYMFRKNVDFWGKEVQWAPKDCYWFVGEKFQGLVCSDCSRRCERQVKAWKKISAGAQHS
ncbi:hypothetical protein B0H13DRAFT_1932828 [Mycena leptocephala]|nr:hypothetical protein B0H13DRAFT_1932828 [Mycena leptocephala]